MDISEKRQLKWQQGRAQNGMLRKMLVGKYYFYEAGTPQLVCVTGKAYSPLPVEGAPPGTCPKAERGLSYQVVRSRGPPGHLSLPPSWGSPLAGLTHSGWEGSDPPRSLTCTMSGSKAGVWY